MHGIYALCDSRGNIKYIGKSRNLFTRIRSSSYQRGLKHYRYFLVDKPADIHFMEPYLILRLNPPLNSEFTKDGVGISIGFRTPSFSILHKVKDLILDSKGAVKRSVRKGNGEMLAVDELIYMLSGKSHKKLEDEERGFKREYKDAKRVKHLFYNEEYGFEEASIYKMVEKYPWLTNTDLNQIVESHGMTKGWKVI